MPVAHLHIRFPLVLGTSLLLAFCTSEQPESLIDGQFDEEFAIGTAPSEPKFANISSMAFAPGGQLVVLDAGAFAVTVFDVVGREVASWGGEGQGPGEFPTRPNSLAVSNNETVAIGTPRGRINVFTSSGDFVDSHVVTGMSVADVVFDAVGDLLVEARSAAPLQAFVEAAPEEIVRLRDRKVLWSSKPLPAFASQPFQVYPTTVILAGLGQGRLVTGVSDEYDLAVLDASTGAELGHIARDVSTRGPSEDFVNYMKSELSPDTRARVTFPDPFPMISEVFAGPPGRTIWVRRHLGVDDTLAPPAKDMVGAPFQLYDLFSSESYQYLGSVQAPEGLRLMAGDSTRVAGVSRGPFNEPSVRVMRFRLPRDPR